MPLNVLFDIGKTALFTSQKALAVTGNNIANVNTPNYSKQDVILEPSMPVYIRGDAIGRGVNYLGVRRAYDRFIEAQIFRQSQNYGRSDVLSTMFGHLEQILNESQDEGLSKAISEFSNAWQNLTISPASIPNRIVTLEKAKLFISVSKNIEHRIFTEINNANIEAENVVSKINDLLDRISKINEQVIQAQAGKEISQANELRDMRDGVLKELSKLINIGTYEDEQGAVNVTIGGTSFVRSGIADKLSIRKNLYGELEIYKDNNNITSRITNGKLGGILDSLNVIKNQILADLRKLVGTLSNEINKYHRLGYGLDGTTGNNFFTPLQSSWRDFAKNSEITAISIVDYDSVKATEYNITFDSTNNYFIKDRFSGELISSGVYSSGSSILFDGISITINGSVMAGDSFLISTIESSIGDLQIQIDDTKKIAAAIDSDGLPGDNRNALKISSIFSDIIPSLKMSLIDYYRGIVTNVGSISENSNAISTFDKNLLQEIESSREAVSGVSIDEEAVDLIRYQRAFEAAAKMITVADEMLQTILKM